MVNRASWVYSSVGSTSAASEAYTPAVAARYVSEPKSNKNPAPSVAFSEAYMKAMELYQESNYKQAVQHLMTDLQDRKKRQSQLSNLTPQQQTEEIKAEAWTTYQLGYSFNQLGESNTSFKYLEKALTLCKKLTEKLLESYVLMELGFLYCKKVQYELAFHHFEQCLAICREIENKNTEANCLRFMGIVFENRGEYDKASDHYHQCLRLSREIKDRWEEMGANSCIADVTRVVGRFRKALRFYKEAMKINTADVHNKRAEAIINNNIGTLYYLLGDYKQSIAHSDLALKICRDFCYKDLEVAVMIALGRVWAAQGQYKTAIEFLEPNLKRTREMTEKHLHLYASLTLGLMYEHTGHYLKAKQSYKNCVDSENKEYTILSSTLYGYMLFLIHGETITAKRSYIDPNLSMLRRYPIRVIEPMVCYVEAVVTSRIFFGPGLSSSTSTPPQIEEGNSVGKDPADMAVCADTAEHQNQQSDESTQDSDRIPCAPQEADPEDSLATPLDYVDRAVHVAKESGNLAHEAESKIVKCDVHINMCRCRKLNADSIVPVPLTDDPANHLRTGMACAESAVEIATQIGCPRLILEGEIMRARCIVEEVRMRMEPTQPTTTEIRTLLASQLLSTQESLDKNIARSMLMGLRPTEIRANLAAARCLHTLCCLLKQGSVSTTAISPIACVDAASKYCTRAQKIATEIGDYFLKIDCTEEKRRIASELK